MTIKEIKSQSEFNNVISAEKALVLFYHPTGRREAFEITRENLGKAYPKGGVQTAYEVNMAKHSFYSGVNVSNSPALIVFEKGRLTGKKDKDAFSPETIQSML